MLPAASVSLRDQVNWVRELRKTGAAALTGVPGATLRIGGIPALNADYQTIVTGPVCFGDGAGGGGDAPGAS